MKQALFYILISAVCTVAFSQSDTGGTVPSVPVSFQDSIRTVLEKTRNANAVAVAGNFATAWNSLGADHQNTIRAQTRQMKQKKFGLNPVLTEYFSAIANAVNIEHTDASRLSEYLKVAQQVIDAYEAPVAFKFFSLSNKFFEHHALHHERTFRLNVLDDDYKFDFIAPAVPVSWEETNGTDSAQQEDPWSDGADEQPTPQEPDSYSEPAIDEPQEVVPGWATPAPQPYIEGPVIVFSKATFNFTTRYDSVFLKNTSGSFSLKDGIFVGDGGSFDWSAAGLSPDSVYCTFSAYNFNAAHPELRSDLVKLNYVGKTPGLIPGTFEFKSVTRKDSILSTYPRFRSYQNDLSIQGFGNENIKYHGGFSLKGNKITSASVYGEYATIEVFENGQKKFTTQSPEFRFADSTVSAMQAKISIYHNNDSIVHRNIRIKYDYGKKFLLVLFDKGMMRHTPYSSSFFSVDFSADVIRWDLKSDSLNIFTEGGRKTVPMVIESIDYYDAEDYRLLKGTGFSFHPLGLVASYCFKKRVRGFYAGDLATHSKKDVLEIKKALEFLSQKGLIEYDTRRDFVQVRPKAIELYRAYTEGSDYDNIKIHSVTDTFANATINFARNYMTVRGVEEFNVSDSLHVRIEPDSSVITLLQNRDIKFDGTIHAGNFEISGKGLTLKYDSFYIGLTQIDSIHFYIMEKNSRGQTIRRRINNSMVGADSTAAAAGGLGDISQSSGTLYISKPHNKSGREKLPNFPRLDASTGGVIYFDRPDVLNGAYDRSVFFVIPPFKIDSLNDADPASINFDGTFVSSGMFPSFKEKLHTMSDKSLGFDHMIPPEGYPLYKTDATMNGMLTLNQRGIRGTGKIDYLAASVTSPDIIFYPDSVVGKGDRATIAKKQVGPVLFPDASLPDFDMKWFPQQDRMTLKTRNVPFNFYDSTAQFRGTLTVSKNGVSGRGKFDTRGTELVSNEMNFTGNEFGSRHAKFKVNSDDPRKPLMYGSDIRLRFNLDENYADINPEIEGVAAINFPYAQVKTSISEARWDLKTQKITMTKRKDVPLENSYFYSTRKELDSLAFNADKAEYDMNTQELKVSGIPYIIVADAKITPENNEVLILENSKIGTLQNTTIIIDTLNGYHRLTQGVVDIVSRKEFSGHATYQYVNFLNDTFAIKMTGFHLEPVVETETSKRFQRRKSVATMQTVAIGSVSENDNVVLGAGMFYKGGLTMYATKPALQLNGFVKLDIKKIKNYNAWIQYEQTGDENEVFINFDNAVNEDGRKVDAGLHFSSLDNELYISFLNDKLSDDDDDFFVPSGVLFYDKEVKEYKIEDREKAAGNKLSGKVFSYNDATMQVRFEGPVSIFSGNKDFNVTATTIGSGNLENNEIRMNTFLMVDSNVPAQAFDLMGRTIQEVVKNEGADEGLGDQTELLYKIADIVGEKVAKDFEQRSLQGYVSLATITETAKPLVFSNVNLKWSPDRKAFYNEGKLGLSNIGRNDINGAFEGFMEIRKAEDGSQIFNLFFKASPEAWYFFGYEGNRLLVHSSDEDFNNVITKKTNAGKAKIGEVAFVPGSDDETLAFIDRFRMEYYGIEVPYNLSEGTEKVKKTEGQEEKQEDSDGF